VSKQVVGQLFVHGMNVFISDVGSARSSGNACVFYFLNILIDTTLGVFLSLARSSHSNVLCTRGVGAIYLTLYILTWFLTEKFHLMGLQSGQYGTPPVLSYWARQAAVYVVSLTSMKLLVIVVLASWRGLLDIGAWLLSWLGNGNTAQVVLCVYITSPVPDPALAPSIVRQLTFQFPIHSTMGFFPILMNVIQFWLIDSIVKAGGIAGISISSDSLDRADCEPLFHSGNELANNEDEDGEDDGGDDGVIVSARKRDVEASGQAQRFRRSNDSTHTYPPSVSGSPSTVPRTSISPPPISHSVLSTWSRHSMPAHPHPRSPKVTTLDPPETSIEMGAEVSHRSEEDWRPRDSGQDWVDRVGEEERTGQPARSRKVEVASV
jgi:STIMATE family